MHDLYCIKPVDADLFQYWGVCIHFKINFLESVRVAALAPLALLLVLEARCTHFVIAHFNNMSSASLLPHITYYT